MSATLLACPALTASELESLRDFLGMPATASEKAVAREWAQDWWWNHGKGFPDDDPAQAVFGVSVEKLHAIANHYEDDYRGFINRRP